MTATTELDRMAAVREQSQEIGRFLDWLVNERGLVIGQFDEYDRLVPHYASIEQRLADFYGIDLQKVDDERRAILASLAAQ